MSRVYALHAFHPECIQGGSSGQIFQEGSTRYTHYSIAYHLVWIPKYRRKILVGEVEAETKRLINECCERHQLRLLALEADIDHVHCFYIRTT